MINQQSIKCGDLNELVAACAQLVATGVTFEANTVDLTIVFTGGY